MVEPVSFGLGSFLLGMFTDGAKALGGDAFKNVGNDISGEVLAQVAGHFSIASNHDSEKAIRRAQMISLRYLLSRYETNMPAEDERAPQHPLAFLDAAFAFAGSCIADCDSETLEARAAIIGKIERSLSAELAGAPTKTLEGRAAHLRAAAERIVFDELKAALAKQPDGAIAIPAGFGDVFHKGGKDRDGKRIVSWHEGFVLQAAKALKGSDPKFEKIFVATRLAAGVELAGETNEIVRLTETAVAKLQLGLQENSDLLIGMADSIAELERNAAARHRQNMAGHAASHAMLRQVMAALDKQGRLQPAVLAGVPESTIIKLAEKMCASTPTLEQALKELARAVEIAADLQRRGAAGSNVSAFVGQVLKRLAELSAAGDYESAAAEADAAIAEAEQRRKAEMIALHRVGLDIDLLRRNTTSAAARVAKIVELETPDPEARFGALRAAQDEWYVRGRDRGLNLDLDVSIEIARLTLRDARTPGERGSAGNDLGVALSALGDREAGAARLEAAADAYKDALVEYTRERLPLDWAMTQNNLGAALQTLGEREAGTALLNEAVDAYRDALKERTRERVPLQWAATQNNLGAALRALGSREAGTARLNQAVDAYRDALKERTRERVPLQWATTQNNLGNALSTLGEREAGTDRLNEAVDAYRDALKERTRERVPLDWAMTQNNLGNALSTLGEREAGTARLEQAVAAYRAALKEYTRERVPLQWAMSTGNQGNTLRELAERTGDLAMARRALAQIEEAARVCRDGGHEVMAEGFESWLPDALALVEKLEKR